MRVFSVCLCVQIVCKMNQICLYCMYGCTYAKNTTKWGFFSEKYPVSTNQDAIRFLFHPSEIAGLGSVNTFMMV